MNKIMKELTETLDTINLIIKVKGIQAGKKVLNEYLDTVEANLIRLNQLEAFKDQINNLRRVA